MGKTGEILVRSLIALGGKTDFGVPADGGLQVLEAVRDRQGQLDLNVSPGARACHVRPEASGAPLRGQRRR